MKNEIINKHTYYSQRENLKKPNSSCNVSSLAIALSVVGCKVTPDELYDKANSTKYKKMAHELGQWVEKYIKRKKLNQIWKILEWLADEYLKDDKRATFKDSYYTFSDIIKIIDDGGAILIGGSFTHGGHIVCAVGYNSLGLICADPWGDWSADYRSKNGNNVLYFYDALHEILKGKNGRFRGLEVRK